ncbi:uncharacterized protein Corp [Drosophila tropicalis]|uniref:uncharacterized protein Corp n=1 Tax=Drosophila tropicalis TaxID=46794 RepID=UPI0035ABD071
MLDLGNRIKISYQNELSSLIYKSGSTYEEVIAQAASHFGIPEDEQFALVLSNGKGGYIFEPRLFEYFIILFPSPEIVFHLRVDYQKLRRGVNKAIKRKRQEDEESANQDQLSSEMNKDRQMDYPDYVFVYRQNCFLGALPSTCAAPVRRQNCFLREQRQQQQQQPQHVQKESSSSSSDDDDEDEQELIMEEQQPQRYSPPKAKRLRIQLSGKQSHTRRRSTNQLISPQL